MKKLHCYFAALVMILIAVNVKAKTGGNLPDIAKTKEWANTRQSLHFIENAGQLEDNTGKPRPDILFTASNGNIQIYLTDNGIHYQFSKTTYPQGYNEAVAAKDFNTQASMAKKIMIQTHHFSISLADANPNVLIHKENKGLTTYNYYTEHHPEGITQVASYEKIVYENVYPHIDWVVYSKGQNLKYDFIVHPGGDPSQIKLKVQDADNTSITQEGALLFTTRLGEVKEKAPATFIDGKEIPSHYKQNSDGTIGFDVKAVSGKTMVIDPFVQWSTYYGGPDSDGSTAFCTTDASGNVYLGGMTGSSTGIAAAGFQITYGGGTNSDAFLVKMNAAGNRLWATYYGGSNDDRGNAGATDALGNIYMAGETNSLGLSAGGFQNTFGGAAPTGGIGDAFLVKFNTSGARIWATYYGGSNDDRAYGCAVDASGNIFIAGSTNSISGIASTGSFQSTYGGGSSTTSDAMGDAFIVKFDAAGNRLWGTYYGGSDLEIGNACALDGTGNIYLTGRTQSSNNIASTGAFQTTMTSGGISAFLVKFNTGGGRIWGTYYGNVYSEGAGCVADAAGNIYLAGHTSSNNNNIASGGFQNTLSGSNDAFLAKFNAAGTRLWGTYYGGTGLDFGFSTTIDNYGFIYLAGQTQSTTGIASGGFQNSLSGIIDGFVAKFDATGNRIWGTYYGGTGFEGIRSCKGDATGSVYLAGFTNSASGVATTGAFQTMPGGGADAFLAKIKELCITDSVTITQNICNTQLPYTWQSNTLSAGGVAVAHHIFQNAIGCDSTVYLNLVINQPPPLVHVYDTVCRNILPLIWNNVSINVLPTVNTATVSFTASSINGCDSITTLHLFVRDSTKQIINVSICASQLPYSWNGMTIPAGGSPAATYTGTNSTGCDSIVILNLTVNNASTAIASINICNNQLPYTWNNIIVTAGGNAVATFSTLNATGCDSTVTLNLNVHNTSATTANLTVCNNQMPYTWNGITVNAGGINVATYTSINSAGCDSVVTLNLTVSPTLIPTVSITASPGTNVLLGTPVSFVATVTNGGNAPIIQWKKNGVNVGTNSANYTDLSLDSADVISCILWSNALCVSPDSAISNALTMIVTTPQPPCLVPLTLVSTDIQFTSAIFKWARVNTALGYEIALDMQPTNPSSGLFTTDTSYHAAALLPGVHYFHIRTKCTTGLYSPWITITITIQNDNGTTGTVNINGPGGGLTLYPNPNNGIFNVLGTVSENNSSIDIVDKSGRIVYKGQAASPNGKLDHHVQLQNIAKGVYLLRVVSGSQVYIIRFVQQ